MHTVDGRARSFGVYHGPLRRLEASHISPRYVLVSLPSCSLTVSDAEQRLRIGKPALDPGVEVGLAVSDEVNADDCTRCVLNRFISSDIGHAKDRGLAV